MKIHRKFFPVMLLIERQTEVAFFSNGLKISRNEYIIS